ncbi:RHS repeat-associated core domain-containing protein [Dactylosporangium sp. AC04546]|uniref:RHS repeat-associated core domain-containing protein n=1 Tax=Dactylosporangium sp. AC04546 TaxID=2862460 RepID=UPI001EDEA3C4|nr:RHS repeat-associated core domain-containing protein [Dactylosporangium sp. AC04546]WVK88682.1 RHS repeat-associated core domain-containing protein [Dactylosporangium sp. AC04546]
MALHTSLRSGRRLLAALTAALVLFATGAAEPRPGHDETGRPAAPAYPVAGVPAHDTAVSVTYVRGWQAQEGMTAQAAGTRAPFGECPGVGAATGCAALVKVTEDGRVAVVADPAQEPFDGGTGATLVGMRNATPAAVRELRIVADAPVFAFGGPGLCGRFEGAVPLGCPYGGTGFEGPGVTFARIGDGGRSGVVRFNPAVPPGGSAWFALAQAPAPSVLDAAGPAVGAQGGAPSASQRPGVVCGDGLTANCATGAYLQQYTDISIPGRGVPLALTRTYSSDRATSPSRFGFGWTDSYAMALTLTRDAATVREENGAELWFRRDGDAFTAPPGTLATLVGDGDGFRFTRRGTGVRYRFDLDGRLVGETDANGTLTRLAYDGDRLTEVVDAAGRRLVFDYDGPRVKRVTGPARQAWTYAYSPAGDLTEVTEVTDGRTRRFEYQHHRLTREVSGEGGEWRTAYGADGRMTGQIDPTDGQTVITYRGDGATAGGGTTTVTNPAGDVTEYVFHGLRLTETTRGRGTADAATTRYTYGTDGFVATVTDPGGGRTRYTYNGAGDVASVTDAEGRTTTYTTDDEGRTTKVVDPAQHETRYDFVGGNLVRTTDATGNTTEYEHADARHPGDVTGIRNGAGQRTELRYDTWGNVEQQVGFPAEGRSVVTTRGYDEAGRVNALGGSGEGGTAVTYNGAGQPVIIEDAASHTTTIRYDRDGNVLSTLDRNNNFTRFEFDEAGRQRKVIRADGSVEEVAYDAAGRPQRQIDPAGKATTYGYDALGRISSMTDPLGRTTVLGHDRTGNVTSITDPSGRVTRLAYDRTGNLLSIVYSDGTSGVRYGYDQAGRRKSMDDGSGHTGYDYDAAGRLEQVVDGAGHAVGYHYNGAGDIDQIRYPTGAVERRYDGAGRVVEIKDWLGHATAFTYDDSGALQEARFPNGVVATHGRSVVAGHDAKFDYERDWTGQVIAATTTFGADPPQRTEYGYDKHNRLGKVDGQEVGYDKAGNLVRFPDGTTQEFDEAGQLRGYGYDAQGNRTRSGAVTLEYDQANRLTRYGPDITHGYDGDGQRTSTRRGTTTASYTWDHSAATPLLLGDGTNTFVYGPDGTPIEQIAADGTVTYLHTDAQGSVRMLTDEHGAVTGTRTFDPFGRTVRSSGASTPLGYAGQYTDPGSGLLYLQARYYDPATAQFLTRDPLAAATLSPYAYAGNNPLNHADPSGLDFWDWLGSVARAALDVVVDVVVWAVNEVIDMVAEAVTEGCERLVVRYIGPLAPGLCGALGGALGGALHYLVGAVETGNFSWSGLRGAAVDGAWQGALEAYGGKLLSGAARKLPRRTRCSPPAPCSA